MKEPVRVELVATKGPNWKALVIVGLLGVAAAFAQSWAQRAGSSPDPLLSLRADVERARRNADEALRRMISTARSWGTEGQEVIAEAEAIIAREETTDEDD